VIYIYPNIAGIMDWNEESKEYIQNFGEETSWQMFRPKGRYVDDTKVELKICYEKG
jgi:hypothetical protein